MPIKITDIKPNPANPRIHDMAGKLDALVRSLLVFPKMLQLREIVVAGKKGKPITQGGNMRLKAIQRIVEMPWEEIEAAQQEITGQDERIAANLEFWKEVRDGKSLPDWCVKYAEDFSAGELKEFIIKDNVGFGEWDWDVLRVDYDAEGLANWGLDVPEWAALDPEGLVDGFSLPDGDRAPFQQMTFTLSDEQAEQVKQAVDKVRKTEEFKYCETFGNENGNGNALYLIVMQWAEQKILD